MFRKIALAAATAMLSLTPDAQAYPPATLTPAATAITLGGLDCGTTYEVRVRDRNGGVWTNQNTYTASTLACTSDPPSSDFTVDPSPAVRNQATTFTATGGCSSPPCSYRWFHGDATSTEEIEPGAAQPNTTAQFTYTGAAGPRSVTLKASDATGQQSSKTVAFQLVDAASTPTPTPTATPTPTPPPDTGAFPNDFNTGVPAGTMLAPSGAMNITTAGAVVDGRDISGSVVVNAPNVTIRNSRIRSSSFWAVDNNSTGLLIEDSEVDGLGANGTCIGSSDMTVRRANIHGCENGFNVSGSTTVEDSYIHDLTTANGAHTDGAQFNQGASDITFRHNTIRDQPAGTTPGSTSDIIMWDEGDPQNTRVWIENNLLDGASTSHPLYPPRQAARDIYINNNHIRPSTVWGSPSYLGYSVVIGSNVTEFNGNVDADTGAAVPRSG
jgi:hypothetical protein